MTNGSFLTSQLPITTNVVSTDRLLVLWNAISNASVGSGSPSTRSITTNDFVNSSLTTILTAIANNGYLAVGNSTVNTQINSTSIYIQTGSGTTFALNTAGVLVGNGYGLTKLPSSGSNQQIQFANSGSLAGANGLTWDLTPQTLTVGNSLVNAVTNSSSLTIGNSLITSTTIKAGNASTIYVGNATHNTVIGVQSIAITNTGVNQFSVNSIGAVVANSFLADTSNVTTSYIAYGIVNASLYVGNSTVNVAANSSTLTISNSIATAVFGISTETSGNSTVNATYTPTSVSFQSNSTSNIIANNTGIVLNGNSTINLAINTTSISYNGISSRESLIYLRADTALTANSNTTAAFVFPSNATLAAAMTYRFEGLVLVSNALASTAAMKVQFSNSAALGSIAYEVSTLLTNTTVTMANGNFSYSNAAINSTSAGTASQVANVALRFVGSIVTSGAVNVGPQICYTAACANTPVVKAGSFFRFVPVTNSTVNTIGTWA
jgi:hypothetical protein